MQNTTIIPHIFYYQKESNLLFRKSKIIEKNISFYCFTACPTQNKDMNQLKHWAWVCCCMDSILRGRQDDILLHPLPPGHQTFLSISTERWQHVENNQLQSRERSHTHERNPRSRVSLLFLQCSDSGCCKGSGVKGLEKRCPLTEPQEGCIR